MDARVVPKIRVTGARIGRPEVGKQRAQQGPGFGVRCGEPVEARTPAHGAPGSLQERHAPSFVPVRAGLCLQNVLVWFWRVVVWNRMRIVFGQRL